MEIEQEKIAYIIPNMNQLESLLLKTCFYSIRTSALIYISA